MASRMERGPTELAGDARKTANDTWAASYRAISPSLPPSVAPSRRFPRRVAVAIVVVGGLLYYSGDQRRPVPAAIGISLSGKAPAANGKRIRVATFNIHGGAGNDRRLDLDRTAAALHGFDLIMLNEVHGAYFWQSAGQAQRLAELTHHRWLFAPTEERWWHHQFGNAVLSSAQVTQWQRLGLPSHGRGYRNLVLLTFERGDRTLHVVGTHLDRNDPRDRAEQFQAATGLFLALAEPAILLGDLNTTADEAPLTELLARADVGDPLREVLGDSTPRRIDWILTRGLKTIDAGIVDDGASDHPLIWAELE